MSVYYTRPNKRIEAVIVGKELKDYPVWFHEAVMQKKIVFQMDFKDGKQIIKSVKVKNIYGGVDIGLSDKDYICKGVAKEIFVCRKPIFEFLYGDKKVEIVNNTTKTTTTATNVNTNKKKIVKGDK